MIRMFVCPDAEGVAPGSLLRAEDESLERYAERSALMDRLFAIPDCGLTVFFADDFTDGAVDHD